MVKCFNSPVHPCLPRSLLVRDECADLSSEDSSLGVPWSGQVCRSGNGHVDSIGWGQLTQADPLDL